MIAALVLTFWVVIASRRSGTEAGALFPWFNAARRAAVGLALVTIMAVTGVGHVIAAMGGASTTPLGEWLRWLHGLTGTLVWLFLIGHGLMALLNHYADEQDLQTIWSIDPGVVDGSRPDDP